MAEPKAHHQGVGHCPQCGRLWTGYKAEHCPACHETFTGTAAGDAHRKGDWPDGRYCTTEDLFWNEDREMWRASEPGAFEIPDAWKRDKTGSDDDAHAPAIAEKPSPAHAPAVEQKPSPTPTSFGEPSW